MCKELPPLHWGLSCRAIQINRCLTNEGNSRCDTIMLFSVLFVPASQLINMRLHDEWPNNCYSIHHTNQRKRLCLTFRWKWWQPGSGLRKTLQMGLFIDFLPGVLDSSFKLIVLEVISFWSFGPVSDLLSCCQGQTSSSSFLRASKSWSINSPECRPLEPWGIHHSQFKPCD